MDTETTAPAPPRADDDTTKIDPPSDPSPPPSPIPPLAWGDGGLAWGDGHEWGGDAT